MYVIYTSQSNIVAVHCNHYRKVIMGPRGMFTPIPSVRPEGVAHSSECQPYKAIGGLAAEYCVMPICWNRVLRNPPVHNEHVCSWLTSADISTEPSRLLPDQQRSSGLGFPGMTASPSITDRFADEELIKNNLRRDFYIFFRGPKMLQAETSRMRRVSERT